MCEKNSIMQKERMNKIFEKQSNIYQLYKSKVLDLEVKKQVELEKVIESQRLMSQERERRYFTEASNLKNESNHMHKKILELQILDKMKRVPPMKRYSYQ